MDQNTQFWVQTLMQILPIGAMLGVFYGRIRAEIKELQKRQDKHNNLMERLFRTEESLASCHHRVTDLTEAFRDHMRKWDRP